MDDRVQFFLPPRSERAHLISLLEVLARVRATTDAPFTELLRRQSVHLPWGATLVIITGSESQALFDTLLYLRRSGFAISLILVQPTRSPAGLEEQASLLNMPVHRIWQKQDVETWR